MGKMYRLLFFVDEDKITTTCHCLLHIIDETFSIPGIL